MLTSARAELDETSFGGQAGPVRPHAVPGLAHRLLHRRVGRFFGRLFVPEQTTALVEGKRSGMPQPQPLAFQCRMVRLDRTETSALKSVRL